MKKKIDPKIFFGVVALLVIVASALLYTSLQPPAPMVAHASANAMYNPGSAQYRQGMMESMQRSQPQQGYSSQYQQGYSNMRSAPSSR